MLPVGLLLTLDMAVKANTLAHAENRLRYSLWLFGMFREDVVWWPGMRRARPSPSGGHIFPFASQYFVRLYRRAVRSARRGKVALSQYQLGRAVHVLVDAACPAHAHPAWHCLHDPFERYVEAHAAEIALLPVPSLHWGYDLPSAWTLIRSLLKTARSEVADHTQSPWGRWLKRRGKRHAPRAALLEAQTTRLIPLAAAHVRVLLRCYERDTGLVISV